MLTPRRNILPGLVLLVLISLAGSVAWADVKPKTDNPTKTPAHYELRDLRPRDESIFDITFGSPPPLATERGILIIDAYNDLNNNQMQDANELSLVEEISCRLGDIDYRVPAFIPGLAYNDSYSISCSGQAYQPTQDQPEVLIEKRGQIIRLNLPCRTRQPVPATPTE